MNTHSYCIRRASDTAFQHVFLLLVGFSWYAMSSCLLYLNLVTLTIPIFTDRKEVIYKKKGNMSAEETVFS